MTKIHKIVLSKSDVHLLNKFKSVRVDKFRIIVDESFEVPQVKVYGKLRV